MQEVLISPIIRIELLSFAGLEKEEEQAIKDLLSQFYSVPLLREIEEQTIQLKRQYKIQYGSVKRIVGWVSLSLNTVQLRE